MSAECVTYCEPDQTPTGLFRPMCEQHGELTGGYFTESTALNIAVEHYMAGLETPA